MPPNPTFLLTHAPHKKFYQTKKRLLMLRLVSKVSVYFKYYNNREMHFKLHFTNSPIHMAVIFSLQVVYKYIGGNNLKPAGDFSTLKYGHLPRAAEAISQVLFSIFTGLKRSYVKSSRSDPAPTGTLTGVSWRWMAQTSKKVFREPSKSTVREY